MALLGDQSVRMEANPAHTGDADTLHPRVCPGPHPAASTPAAKALITATPAVKLPGPISGQGSWEVQPGAVWGCAGGGSSGIGVPDTEWR